MDSQDILDRIQALVSEERQLREESAASGIDNASEGYAEGTARLRDVEQELDSFASLLRNRKSGGQITEGSANGNQPVQTEEERENESSFVGDTDSPKSQDPVNPATDTVPGAGTEPPS